MTEAEWFACTDPQIMLEFLRGKASDRKIRLFACACVRRVWHLLTTYLSRRSLDVAESYADGRADDYERMKARRVMDYRSTGKEDGRWEAFVACEHCVRNAQGTDVAVEVSSLTVRAAQKQSWFDEPLMHCSLLREIFGLAPFHPVTISPAVLAWNDAVVVRLAQAAYEERQLPAGALDHSRLAILADALKEAGWTSEEILGHLRGPGPHVRGCWPVDLCLGKS